MEWAEFKTRLTRTIRDMDDRVFLILDEPSSGAYVQFAADADTVSAECVANTSKALKRQATPAGELRLVELGWTPYTPAQPNWTTSLDLPATLDHAGRIADMCITALREVYDVASPDSLTYQAWRAPETPRAQWDDDELDEFGEAPPAPDPGQNPLPLPGLGLAPE